MSPDRRPRTGSDPQAISGPERRQVRPQPELVAWVSLGVTAFAFAVLFKASRRDYPWVMGAAVCGYLIGRHVGDAGRQFREGGGA